jgi:hypothetical protein
MYKSNKRGALTMAVLGALLTAAGAESAHAQAIESNGSLGALVIPDGAKVTVDTINRTLSWAGGGFVGRSLAYNGGAVTVFDFTDISIGAGVAFNILPPPVGIPCFVDPAQSPPAPPLAIVGTGNATIASGISVAPLRGPVAGAGAGGSRSSGGDGRSGGLGGGGGTGGVSFGYDLQNDIDNNGHIGDESQYGRQGRTWDGQVGFGQGNSTVGVGGTPGGGGEPGDKGMGVLGGLNDYDAGSRGVNGTKGRTGSNGDNGTGASNTADATLFVLVAGSGGGSGGSGGGGGGGGAASGGGGGLGKEDYTYTVGDPPHQVVTNVWGGDGGYGGSGGRGGYGGAGGQGGSGGGALYIGVRGRLTLGADVAFSADGGNGMLGESGALGYSGGRGRGRAGYAGEIVDEVQGGRGGDGGNGGDGGDGGNGGNGAGGAGGTIMFSSSLLRGTRQASFSAAGGEGADAGQILLAANNAISSPSLQNGEQFGLFLGERAANAFLYSALATPYLPDVFGGPNVAGTVSDLFDFEGKTELTALKNALPAGLFSLAFASEDSPFIGFDELFVCNLSDSVISGLELTIDGVGAGTVDPLAPGESWTTLVPDGGTQGIVGFGVPGSTYSIINTAGLGPDFIVGGATVPEPASLALLGVGLACLLTSKCQRNNPGRK